MIRAANSRAVHSYPLLAADGQTSGVMFSITAHPDHHAAGPTSSPHYRSGAFIAEHGSWNRGYSVGFKVVYVPFRDGLPAGNPEDFLTGFKPDPTDTETYGRPTGVITDKAGGLLVTDDAANIIWQVRPSRG